jgi:hypothetical protein
MIEVLIELDHRRLRLPLDARNVGNDARIAGALLVKAGLVKRAGRNLTRGPITDVRGSGFGRHW